jgi:hypothetical protein
VLRSWTSATIDRLQEEFDARTIVLRAFIMTTVDRRTSDDRDALVADLDALESVGHGPVDSAHGA